MLFVRDSYKESLTKRFVRDSTHVALTEREALEPTGAHIKKKSDALKSLTIGKSL